MMNGIFNKKPDTSWLETIKKDVEHTPDGPELARCDFHHLFVIDDLQRGRKFHKILSKGEPVFQRTGFTESVFHCWKRMPDNPYEKEELPPIHVVETLIIPLPKQDQRNITEWVESNRMNNRLNHWAKIKGELWKVPSKHFYELDKFMENGIVFKRRRVMIETPVRVIYSNGSVDRKFEEWESYMYIGIPEFWEPQLDGGYYFRPMTIYNNNSLNRKYYCYTLLED